MGGKGSGTWERIDRKTKTNEVLRLDISILRRNSILDEGIRVPIAWSDRGKVVKKGFVFASEDSVILEIESSVDGARPGLRSHVISLDHSACNFGGKRAWFLCPACERRVRMLYEQKNHFHCRSCSGLVYPTQSWGELDQAGHRASQVRKKLGGPVSLGEPFPLKPRGMHEPTYYELMKEGGIAERRFWNLLSEAFDQLFR